MMLMKKIMVTYGRQLTVKIALHAFLYASYPIVGSKTYSTVFNICTFKWLLLFGKVKKIQTTIDNLSTGGHEDRDKTHVILWKGGMTSGIT